MKFQMEREGFEPRTRRSGFTVRACHFLATSHINQQDLLYHWFTMIGKALIYSNYIFSIKIFNCLQAKENPHFHFDNSKLPSHVCNFTHRFPSNGQSETIESVFPTVTLLPTIWISIFLSFYHFPTLFSLFSILQKILLRWRKSSASGSDRP